MGHADFLPVAGGGVLNNASTGKKHRSSCAASFRKDSPANDGRKLGCFAASRCDTSCCDNLSLIHGRLRSMSILFKLYERNNMGYILRVIEGYLQSPAV